MPLIVVLLFAFMIRLTSCACPSDHYPGDAWPHTCQHCPPHTRTILVATAVGALSAHDCKCDPGFLCMYYKQVRATVTLNTTLTAFEHDEHGVRSGFVSDVARAAGVGMEKVHLLHFVVIRLDHRRRARRRVLWMDERGMLSVTLMVNEATSDTSVLNLQRHLGVNRGQLESWHVERRVLVLEIPSSHI